MGCIWSLMTELRFPAFDLWSSRDFGLNLPTMADRQSKALGLGPMLSPLQILFVKCCRAKSSVTCIFSCPAHSPFQLVQFLACRKTLNYDVNALKCSGDNISLEQMYLDINHIFTYELVDFEEITSLLKPQVFHLQNRNQVIHLLQSL